LLITSHRDKLEYPKRHSAVRPTTHILPSDFKHSTLYSSVLTLCTSKFNTELFYVPSTQCIYLYSAYLRANSHFFSYTA